MVSKDIRGGGVKSTGTALDIVAALQELDGAGVTALANHLGLAKSTVHAQLRTLYEREYVIVEDNIYYLSLKFLDHGWYARERMILPQLSQSVLDELAEQTSEAVWLITEEHGLAVYLARAIGDRAAPTQETEDRFGKRRHLHDIAAGKAILAYLPEDRVWEIIDRRGLPRQTDHTLTEPEALFEELEIIRERGFAFNLSESYRGARAVAAPIVEGGDVYGSITVAGPEHRMKGERLREKLPDIILGATNEVELKLSHQSR